jgi:hypothetical protein
MLGLEVQRRHVIQDQGRHLRWPARARRTALRSCRGSRGPRSGPGCGASSCRWRPCGPGPPGPAPCPGPRPAPRPGPGPGPEHLIAQDAGTPGRRRRRPGPGTAPASRSTPPAAHPQPPAPCQGGSASNSAGAASLVTSRARGAAGSIPRSNAPWAGSASLSRARSSKIPSSASVCADPTCATIFLRPPSYPAICTAVAPDAVRTRRIHATAPSLGHQLVPETRPRRRHRSRSGSRQLR